MMDLQFNVRIELSEQAGERAQRVIARQVLLKLAAELIRCSVAADDESPPLAVRIATRGRRRPRR